VPPPVAPPAGPSSDVDVQADRPRLEIPVWHEVADDHGFLEWRVNALASSPLLVLHVVFDADAGGTLAWWEDEHGASMVRVEVADA
jgi:hypothetical protein